jgi:release factor glutamine methyltransferase
MPEDKTRIWTVRELMKSAMEHLQRKGFEDARLNVELLLAHALDLQRIQLYLHFDRPLTSEELTNFRSLYERRLKREPVQYIIGSTNFMGLHFAVDSRVLIPRPETETLIEQTMLLCQRYPSTKTIQVLEVGTGSGNIAVSIAKYIRHAHVTAIDISRDALDVAEMNARMHSVDSQILFSLTDIFDSADELFQKRFDLLVSNPPYIPKDEWEQLQTEVRDFEPCMALTDGKNGLQFYYRLIGLIPDILKSGGGIMLEVGFNQAQKVAREMKNAGIKQLQIANDLQGIPRVVSGIWTGPPSTLIHLN